MIRAAGRHATLLVVAAVFIAPIAMALSTALMTDRQIDTAALWPQPFRWRNFADAVDDQPLWHMAWITVQISALSVIGVLLSSVPAAYALARLRWRGRDAALVVVLCAFLLPAQITAIPLFVTYAHLHWVGTILPLVMPSFLGDAFSIFLLRQFFLSVPETLLDAYRLEGAGEWRVMARVVLPMSRPGIAAVALLNVIFSWNDFFTQYLYLGSRPDRWTLSIGLAQYRSVHEIDWNRTMAAAMLVSLPLVGVFLLAQRLLMDGVAAQVRTP